MSFPFGKEFFTRFTHGLLPTCTRSTSEQGAVGGCEGPRVRASKWDGFLIKSLQLSLHYPIQGVQRFPPHL